MGEPKSASLPLSDGDVNVQERKEFNVAHAIVHVKLDNAFAFTVEDCVVDSGQGQSRGIKPWFGLPLVSCLTWARHPGQVLNLHLLICETNQITTFPAVSHGTLVCQDTTTVVPDVGVLPKKKVWWYEGRNCMMSNKIKHVCRLNFSKR